MLTADDITPSQIRSLRSEAATHGDDLLVAWCNVALAYAEDGDEVGDDLRDPVTGEVVTRSEARAVCADVINAAAAADL